MATRIKTLMRITIQIAALLLISEAGSGFVRMLHLPLPGNLVGMLLLLGLLTAGVIRLEWVEAGAALLVRHLAIFFIPIAVGLMVFGDVFLHSGIAIVATLMGYLRSTCDFSLLERYPLKRTLLDSSHFFLRR